MYQYKGLLHIFMQKWVQITHFYIFGGGLEKVHGHKLMQFLLDGVKDIRVGYEFTLTFDLACIVIVFGSSWVLLHWWCLTCKSDRASFSLGTLLYRSDFIL